MVNGLQLGGGAPGDTVAYRKPAPAPKKAAPKKSAPAQSYYSAPAPDYSGIANYLAGSSGGGGGGGGYSAPAPAPAQTAPNQNTWLASDAGYKAQLAALTKAMSDYQADNTRQQSQYNVDYGNSLKNLGYDPNSKAWNTTDTNTAAGRSTQNLVNDFATRGLLQSSLYGEADNNLMRSLNDQLTGVNTAKQNFVTNLASQLSAYKNQNNASQQQAKADALARYAAQYGA